MQNTSFSPCASLAQAGPAIESRSPDSNTSPDRDYKFLWVGQGARALETRVAVAIGDLSQRYGHARARRLSALSGYAIDGAHLAEIYHGQFARAATATQSGPDFARPEWQEARAAAVKEPDAAHYSNRTDALRLVSRDDADSAAIDDSPAMREWSALTCRRGSLRRIVRHARECLVAHWSLSGSRTWRAALADDLARLTTLTRVARGASFGEFGIYDDFNSSAARKSFQRLAERMASGDLIMTENPESAQNAIDHHRLSVSSKFA